MSSYIHSHTYTYTHISAYLCICPLAVCLFVCVRTRTRTRVCVRVYTHISSATRIFCDSAVDIIVDAVLSSKPSAPARPCNDGRERADVEVARVKTPGVWRFSRLRGDIANVSSTTASCPATNQTTSPNRQLDSSHFLW